METFVIAGGGRCAADVSCSLIIVTLPWRPDDGLSLFHYYYHDNATLYTTHRALRPRILGEDIWTEHRRHDIMTHIIFFCLLLLITCCMLSIRLWSSLIWNLTCVQDIVQISSTIPVHKTGLLLGICPAMWVIMQGAESSKMDESNTDD